MLWERLGTVECSRRKDHVARVGFWRLRRHEPSMTKGRTSQADAEFYLEVRKCLKADEGQSAEHLEVLARNLVAVVERWAAAGRSGPRGRTGVGVAKPRLAA